MKNVSIYEKKWLDLVFEGKNKEYGAYKLRQENGKTSLLAFAVGVFFLSGSIFLLSSFTKKEADDTTPKLPPIVVTHVETDPTVVFEKPKSKIETPKTKVETPQKVIPTSTMVVATTETAVAEVPTNNDLPVAPTNPNGSDNGTAVNTGNNGGSNDATTIIPSKPEGPLKPSELDRLPNYPGGIKKFYEYVGNNFDQNSVDENETVRINVSFVIEKNGTMTDIKVLENKNPSINREAIRLLKSLKTKWSPGYKNGEPVRAYFTLPITVSI